MPERSCLPPICRRTITRLARLALLLPLCLTPFVAVAEAASSDWATNEGGRMRLVLLPAAADGSRAGVLLIEPKPGWITYWKEPGEVGIPPSIAPAPGADYSVRRVDFPVPKLLSGGELQDVGYDHPVALPIVLDTAPDDRPVALSAFVGVCQNICIPFQADLVVAPDRQVVSDPAEVALVKKAQGLVPPGPSADFRVTGHRMQPDAKSLEVSLRLPADAPLSQVFISGPSGHVYVDGITTAAADGETLFTVPIGKLPEGYTLAGKRWGILVVASDRAMETALAFD